LETKKYKIAVLGSGPAGYTAAINAAKMGASVAVIERDSIGGVCLNRGCIPTKTLVSTAYIFKKIKESNVYGIDIDGKLFINWKGILERKDSVVSTLTTGIKRLFTNYGVDVINGNGVIENNLL